MLEIIRPNPAPGRLRFAVFDFDGTLSLLRTGWQRVMTDLMVEALQATPRAVAEDELRIRTAEPVFGLAGRPTLVQMQWLVNEVRQRGGMPQTAEAYKHQYLVRLSERIRHRADLEAGRQPPERFRVRGALEFVAALHARGVACYIASGTARLWDVDYHTTMDYLCSRLLRNFTEEERAQFGITDNSPTCPAK